MKHIIESQQFDQTLIAHIFDMADNLLKKGDKSLEGKIMACLFYEPSTRTRFSFESAMIRLGGSVISTENAKEFSSASKGESIEDTVRVVSNYADVIILRHYEQGATEKASLVSSAPIINAGDGIGQHPTQALLDLFTIQKEQSKIDGISIAMVGDLKNGRTVKSLSYLLGKYNNINIAFVSPKGLRISEDITDYLTKHKVSFSEVEDLEQIIGDVEVIYQTRIQKERFDDIKEYEGYKGKYVISPRHIDRMKPDAIIMHPLPRVDEISIEVDKYKNAAYFRQAKYGLYVRMALLKYVLE
jgi:aspartate carbamoyltransferase catalytic subunit